MQSRLINKLSEDDYCGLTEILTIGKLSGGVSEEPIDGEAVAAWLKKTHDWSYYGYGDPNWVEHAVRLQDGSILIVFSISAFLSTFDSHDDVRIEWWHLVPETDEERQLFKQRKKK